MTVAQTKAVHEGATTAVPEVFIFCFRTYQPFSKNIMYVTEMSPALNNSAALMQATEGCDHICARVAIQKTCRCVNTVAERKIMLYTTCK